MAGFHMEHFGCRAARADGEAVSERLRAAGQHCAQQLPEADLVIVNTCSVTAEADRQARAFIRRAHRANPEAKIVVTGCYAQRAPEELAGMAGVAAVVGNSHKALVPKIVLDLIASGTTQDEPADLVSVHSLLSGGARTWVDDRFAHSFLEEAQLLPGAQTRPNLKIQEGCGNRCTFCVIPTTRGLSKSLSHAAVMRQVAGFVAAGGKELVLSGINLGRWGRDLQDTPDKGSWLPRVLHPKATAGPSTPAAAATSAQDDGQSSARDFGAAAASGHSLSGLVREILERTELPRLRLSSIEPMDWDGELIGLMAEFGGSRLARHAHLPLQSGSDAVLRRMHRRYRPWHYAEKVEALLRAAGPELTLGADVMAGFPGETDAEFEETLDFVRALPFGYLHLFPFSPRPGTRGWALHARSPVAAAAVEERMAALRALAAEKTGMHRRRFIGRELESITLNTPGPIAARCRTEALTENFLPVEIDGSAEANRLVRVRVMGLSAEGVLQGAFQGVLQNAFRGAFWGASRASQSA
jgi:threonylcarbamoyladenosine tRNA methylthiotransferase MtaB